MEIRKALKHFERIKINRFKRVYLNKKITFDWIAILISFAAFIVSLIALFKTIEGTKISNRPFVIVETPKMYSLPDFDGKQEIVFLQIFLNVRNIGNTPAYNVQLKTCINIYEDDFPLKPYFPSNNTEFNNTLIKDADYQLEVRMYRKFTISEVKDLISKKNFVYIYGVFTYSDIFNDSHITEFCYRLLEFDFDGFRPNKNHNSAN
ncbi:MAG: hypothetical protein Q8N83_17010 [Ignavibacteria bacterium]|nr:hypothetical protein [Ignavibacteria bacterium]